jgi:PIN domain nuclease of toxin-antitoxin system
VRLLLDTHVFLWAITANPRLGEAAFAMIRDPKSHPVVSAITILEIAIKHQLQREAMPIPPKRAIELCESAGYELLPVLPTHAAAVSDLPRHHGDPFDRLLIAQALTEPLRLMTRDRIVATYSDTIILV